MTYLPPKEVELAGSVLAIVADAKACQARLDALKAAAAEYEAVSKGIQTETMKNEQIQKQLALDTETLKKEKAEFEAVKAIELPKLAERDKTLTRAEAAIELSLKDLTDKQKAFDDKVETENRNLVGRERRVSIREAEVKSREENVTARETDVKKRMAQLKTLVE